MIRTTNDSCNCASGAGGLCLRIVRLWLEALATGSERALRLAIMIETGR